MIKAFISHSSKQKDYATKLVNLIGRDYCIIDCYDFEPAYKSIDEIYRAIERCTVFVLLISRESLSSFWVKEEIDAAIRKFNPSQLERFWPYIIDSSLSIEECPEWIRSKESFNLHKFSSPELLRLDIEQKFRRIIWRSNPDIMALETELIGRQEELGQFEQLRYSMNGQHLRALIISGRIGVGKESFARQCLYKQGRPREMEPCRISLDVKNGLEDFLIQLNLIIRLFDNEELRDVLSASYQSKIDVAVRILNAIFDMQQVLFIDDNMACVLPDKNIPSWLADIVSHESINKQLALFIKSRITPNTYLSSDFPRLAHIHLNPLNKADRKKLFYSLAQNYHLEGFSDKDVNFFVEKLLESPSQIHEAVKAIKQHGVLKAKNDIGRLVEMGDERAKPLIDHFKESEISLNILIILARFEFLDFHTLEEIFEGNEKELQFSISDMLVYGVISTFGVSGEYIRLDHYFCDFIRRNRIPLSKELTRIVDDVIETKIIKASITRDISVYFYDLQQKIMKQQYSSDSFLVPSVVIKAVIEAYHERNYQLVISICEKIGEDSHLLSAEVNRELDYWHCLSLCRTIKENEGNRDKFWELVKGIGGADNDFLKGFFFRYDGNYRNAEKYLRRALNLAPNMDRAKRELVTVLMDQDKYGEALQMARDNYERDNGENTYHIYAYFRCLVRKPDLTPAERDLLLLLMQQVEDSYSDKKDELFAAMEISYASIIERRSPTEMLQLIKEKTSLFPRSIDVARAANEYRKKQKLL